MQRDVYTVKGSRREREREKKINRKTAVPKWRERMRDCSGKYCSREREREGRKGKERERE